MMRVKINNFNSIQSRYLLYYLFGIMVIFSYLVKIFGRPVFIYSAVSRGPQFEPHLNTMISYFKVCPILLDCPVRQIPSGQGVVHFDQQTHACACVRMVENDEKHKKMMKKYLLVHAHERLAKKKEEKSKNNIIYTFRCIEHVEKSTKTTKFQISNQLLGVTPNR